MNCYEFKDPNHKQNTNVTNERHDKNEQEQEREKKMSKLGNGDSQCIKLDESQLEMLENLSRFKNECLFTDIYIYVDGVEFPCHKVILCAASNYFKAMFSCDLKESRLGKVFIENISPWTMKRLLDYIYTGKVEINYDNVIDIFNAAVMFQLFKLADKCTTYIQQHIDIQNCIEINLFASMHNLVQLENDTFQFILENFMQLINLNNSFNGSSAVSHAKENLENETNGSYLIFDYFSDLLGHMLGFKKERLLRQSQVHYEIIF